MLRDPNTLVVNKDFDTLLPPLHEEELRFLTESVRVKGIKTPITLWKGHDIVVDGHNRLRIAKKLGLTEVPCEEEEFRDEKAVRVFIYRNQIGRRNISPQERSIYTARYYQTLRANLGTVEAVNRIALEQNVSTRTVFRDIKVATLLEEIEEPLREKYLSGDLSYRDLIADLKTGVDAPPQGITKDDRDQNAIKAFPRSVQLVAERVITGVETLRGLCRDVDLVFENQGLKLADTAPEMARYETMLESLVDEAEKLATIEHYDEGIFLVDDQKKDYR